MSRNKDELVFSDIYYLTKSCIENRIITEVMPLYATKENKPKNTINDCSFNDDNQFLEELNAMQMSIKTLNGQLASLSSANGYLSTHIS